MSELLEFYVVSTQAPPVLGKSSCLSLKLIKLVLSVEEIRKLERVVSDNGPQFAAEEFSRFAHDWEFRHVTMSPHYLHENGLVGRFRSNSKALTQESQDRVPGSLPQSFSIQEQSNRWISLSIPTLNEQKTSCNPTNDQESA